MKKNSHAAALGALGGKATTPRKIAAGRKNLEKARAKRWRLTNKKRLL